MSRFGYIVLAVAIFAVAVAIFITSRGDGRYQLMALPENPRSGSALNQPALYRIDTRTGAIDLLAFNMEGGDGIRAYHWPAVAEEVSK